MNPYPNLFSPYTLKTMTLKNRVVMSPMGSNFAGSDGQMSREHVEYYRLRAAGGVGLIILENVSVDNPRGSNGTTQLRLDHDSFIPRLYLFNETMHKYGACTSVQLNHGGCKASPARIGCPAEAPSALPMPDGSLSEEMSREEIYRVAAQYGKAAKRAKDAGFDCVEIHAGHAYLVNQFLSPLWNHRTDEFGGSPENRARFCRLVIDEIRKNVGEQYPVLMRVSVDDFTAGGSTVEDSLAMLKLLRDGVDLLDCSSGVKYAMDAAQLPDGWKAYLAGRVRRELGVPCSAVGNIRDPKMAEELIANGTADLIVIGRGLIADPDWPRKARAGRAEEIRPCISCNIGCVTHRAMLNQPIRCTVNPSVACEEWHKANKVRRDCNVVVIGGGAAGLEAACTAAETGCRVTLFEKEKELGGWMRKIAEVPQKYRMSRLLGYMLRRAEKLKNLTCLTGVTVTPELLDAFKPDVVVWSVGSAPLLPNIPGLRETIADANAPVNDVREFLDHIRENASVTGKRVAIAGGGAVALDIAEFYAENGNEITIVEMLPEIGRGLDGFSKNYVKDLLTEHHAKVLTSHKLEEVRKDSFVISAEGKKEELTFDLAYVCLGLRNLPTDETLRAHCEEKEIPFLVVGDAKRGRRLYEAINEGREIVETIRELGYYD